MNSVLVILTLVNAAIGARENPSTIIDSYKKPSGTIYSKGFPYSYNIEPEVFDFRGLPNEKVQITFDKFNLFPKTTVNERCGIEGSFISYKKTEKSPESEKFCGDHKPLPIMSEDEHFILRYEPVFVPVGHPVRDQNEEIGFNATFRFVKNFGIDDKMAQTEYGCDFSYDSENLLNGTFSSPNFPGMFPGRILCYYTFRGVESNIVLTFTQFNLLGSEDCDAEIEKKDKLQILTTSDGVGHSDDKKEYCGNRTTPFNVTITNSTAFIIFYHQTNYSDYELAKNEFVGFNASFLFTNETVSSTCDRRLPDIVSIFVCLYLILKQRGLF